MKAKAVLDPEEREQWAVVVGVLTFALAIFVIIIAFGSYAGWSPAQYTVEMNCDASGNHICESNVLVRPLGNGLPVGW